LRVGAIELPEGKIEEFCRRWKIAELALFGSALSPDHGPESDVDLLVTFDTNAKWSLLDHVRMQDELREILRRDVDLVSRRGIENSRNRIRRRAILESARVIYGA
jgi:predicted nucleotidyltransferase